MSLPFQSKFGNAEPSAHFQKSTISPVGRLSNMSASLPEPREYAKVLTGQSVA
jgi:hypothetical protein